MELNLKIIDEFIPDWILGVKDSMQLDSGQEVCSITVKHQEKTIEAYVVVHGEVKVFYKDNTYKSASKFPQELLDYFAGKRPELEDEVIVDSSNWFELIFDDDPCSSEIIDGFEEFTSPEDVRQWLQDVIEERILETSEK